MWNYAPFNVSAVDYRNFLHSSFQYVPCIETKAYFQFTEYIYLEIG